MTEPDLSEIQSVVFAYARNLDMKTPEKLAEEVFASDAVVDLGYGSWNGTDRITREFAAELEQFEGTAHILTNFAASVEGDTARSTVYVTAWHWTKGRTGNSPTPEADFVSVGVYVDRLERRLQGWRIVHRRFRRLGPSAVGIGNLPDFIQPLA